MRIDVKTVKGRHYLQYVDKNGCLHHLGSANDFDSWLLSLIIWNKEYLDRRKEFFESIKAKARQYIELVEGKEGIIDAIFHRYVPNASEAHKKRIYVPKIWTFYVRAREWSARLQKRLDEVYRKQRRIERKKRRIK